MTRRPFRIFWLLPALTAAAALAAGLVAYRSVVRALAEAGVTGPAAAHVSSGTAVTVIVLGLLAVVAAAIGARLLAGSMARLRGSVLARARGEADVAFLTNITDLAAIDQAVDRLAVRVAAREAEVEGAGARVAALFDAISEGILQLDAAGRIARVNPRAKALLGLSAESVGKPVAAHVRHADLRLLLDRALRGQPVDAAEISIGERRVIVSARPLPMGADGRTDGTVVAFVDLTEIRRLEGVRRDFVANVSHELKTPLTSIRGYTETMLNDELPPELQRQFLEVVHKNADRLHRIVDDLLDLSRLESGGWRPELTRVNVADLVADVWSAHEESARERRMTFVAPAARHFVRADPGGLRQVLSNLLENALRYTPDGGRIEVRTSHDGDRVIIEIADDGTGIPLDALPRIFERFYRVDPARSRAAGGTGLGLSIVRHLTESMTGDVSAESELGKGTTIRVRLPAA
jgi:two-component system, OmpR family, phosphate regulon sensor histidine kinase PhoR